MTVRLDGQLMTLVKRDIDGDGRVDRNVPEVVRHDAEVITQPTELGQVMSSLNEDIIEEHTMMSSIDMKANLHWAEVSAVLGIDTLSRIGVVSKKWLYFTRQKKRLSISVAGRGRDDMVKCVVGERERTKDSMPASRGFFDRLVGFGKKEG